MPAGGRRFFCLSYQVFTKKIPEPDVPGFKIININQLLFSNCDLLGSDLVVGYHFHCVHT